MILVRAFAKSGVEETVVQLDMGCAE